MVHCGRCGKEQDTYSVGANTFCGRCSCQIIERRVRKHLRLHEGLKPGMKLFVVDPFLKSFLPKVMTAIPVTFVESEEDAVAVLPNTIDDQVTAFLATVFYKQPAQEKKVLQPLTCVTDKEMQLYSKIKGLKFSPQPKDQPIEEALKFLEEQYPAIRYALANSAEEFQALQKN